MDFYTIVIIIAIVLLIAVLTGLGLMLTKVGTTAVFPDVVRACPDGWYSNDGKCSSNGSTNVRYTSIGAINYPTDGTRAMSKNSTSYINLYYNTDDFKDAAYYYNGDIIVDPSKMKNICDQKTWANANGIVWDGVTNSNTKC